MCSSGSAQHRRLDRYLWRREPHVITEFWEVGWRPSPAARPVRPRAQDFWVASDAGRGDRTLLWEPANGEWTVVVMNVDGRPGLDVGADLGAKVPALLWVGLGVALAEAVLLLGGVLLIVSAIRRRRDGPATTA